MAYFPSGNDGEGIVLPDYTVINTLLEGKIAYDFTTSLPVFYNGTQWCTFDGTPV